MQEVLHSVCRRAHKVNVILTMTGHELLFISLDFMVPKWLWVMRLHDEYTYQAVNTHTYNSFEYCHSDRKSSCFLQGSSVCIQVCTS